MNETFLKFNIIYLADGSEVGFISAASIQRELGAEVVRDWQSAQAALNTGGVDAILISNEMIAYLDNEVLLLEYKRGLTLVFFNTYAEQITDLLRQASFDKGWTEGAAEPMTGDFFIRVWRMTKCEHGETAYSDLTHPCDPMNSYMGGIKEWGQSSSAGELNSRPDFERFIDGLAFELEQVSSFSEE